jgi:hypothetical protein
MPSEIDDNEDLKVQIASKFLADAPPGELHEVLNGNICDCSCLTFALKRLESVN